MEFGDDVSYLEWVQTNPEGFVVNLRRPKDRSYIVLHRASCRTISDARRPSGAYTERGYRKAAAMAADALRAVARAEGRADGSFSKCCALCDPLAGKRAR